MTADWRRLAACAEADVQLGEFFPERPGDNGLAAKRLCALCPVRRECLVGALASREEFGIWGGAGEQLRRPLARLYWNTRGVCRNDARCACAFCTATAHHFARLDEFARTGVLPAGAQETFGAGATHGRASTAAKGCPCSRCRLASANRTKESAPRRNRSATRMKESA